VESGWEEKGKGHARMEKEENGERKREARLKEKGRRLTFISLMHSWNQAADWLRPALGLSPAISSQFTLKVCIVA